MEQLRNRVQLIGHLGQPPEIATTDKGKKYARFSMATNEQYRDTKGEKVVQTTWHQLIAWGKLAELVEKHLHKGKEVAVAGKLITHNYTDKNGAKRYAVEILVYEILMLGAKSTE